MSYFIRGICTEDRRFLTTTSGGSLSKNKTTGEAWSLINDVPEATQHVRVRSNPLKGVVEAPPSESSLPKVLGDMTTILMKIHKEQKAFYSIQAVQSPPQVPQLEGPPRICGLCSSTAHYTDQCHQIQEEYTLAVANVNYNNRPPTPLKAKTTTLMALIPIKGEGTMHKGAIRIKDGTTPLLNTTTSTNLHPNTTITTTTKLTKTTTNHTKQLAKTKTTTLDINHLIKGNNPINPLPPLPTKMMILTVHSTMIMRDLEL
ncbi:hypothetical protein Ahy_A09g044743 [Arachis hypogaea]|uniref:Uncharacterized protein n=1 Tax=Arachis hypogaea TaxID=3818 RepID=A0A445BKQ0_ARAHY|nr:hypothetical protein Ahy_A09g044743 [Arachis hypogaea]